MKRSGLAVRMPAETQRTDHIPRLRTSLKPYAIRTRNIDPRKSSLLELTGK